VDTARVSTFGLMHLEELLDLAQDLREVAGLVTAAGLDGVAVHRVAAPQHFLAFPLNCSDQARQMIADLVGAHACDQVQAARVVVRVEDVDQANQIVGVHAWADFHPDRVLHPAQKLDMRAVQLARAVADPQHVRRAVVEIVGQAVTTHEGFFVVEQQRFVGGEEAGFTQLRRGVHAAGAHEGQRFVDSVGQMAVLFRKRGACDEIQVPLMHLVQIGKTALSEGAQQVQGGGGLVIGLQQTIRVRHAALLVETDAVDDIAAIGRQGDAINGFVIGGARFGELAGHAPDLDHRATGGKGHDDRHLQQNLEGVADFRGGKLEETLGAIATLQQERATLGDRGKLTA